MIEDTFQQASEHHSESGNGPLVLLLRGGMILASVILAIATSRLAWTEYAAMRSSTMSAPDLFVAHANAGANLPFALGYRTRTDLLDRCALAQTDFIAGLMPAAFLENLANDCLTNADAALAGMPVFGVAHVARAASLASLNNVDGFRAALVDARIASPREGWLVSRRMSLAVSNYARLDAPTRDALLPDIAVLASTAALRRDLAMLYVLTPDARAWIEAGVETADEAAQAAFLAAVRSASGA